MINHVLKRMNKRGKNIDIRKEMYHAKGDESSEV